MISQLRERLFLTKLKLKEDVEQRRDVIRKERDERKSFIRNTEEALQLYKMKRADLRKTAVSRKPEPHLTVTSPAIETLRKKLLERTTAKPRK